MKQSHLFTKTRKDIPKDEVSKNAELLIRAGYVYKEMAGVYSFLPLGLRVLKNIEQIIREEMDFIGGQELVMTALQDKAVWEKTGRWADGAVDNWFKTQLKNKTELGLGLTHEEPIAAIMKDHILSYKDLPVYAYQFQVKFRNESRAKSGILRGREFLMKDLYSFSATEKEHTEFYKKAREAYLRIFKKLGIGDVTYPVYASGGIFTDTFSEEFQTLCEAGEDLIYIDKTTGVAVNKEILDEMSLAKLNLKRENMEEKKAIEVANIYNLGTKTATALGLEYKDEKGNLRPVVMGSYGIGLSRVMGTIVEVFADENGIVWPESVAPFAVHIVALFDKEGNGGKVGVAAEKLYKELAAKKIEVLYDDRDARPGEKFADSDLIGIPLRVVVSEKNLVEGVFEVKHRKSGEVEKVSEAELLKMLIG